MRACVDEGISSHRKWGSIVNPPELELFLQRGGDSKPNQWGAQRASWSWWKLLEWWESGQGGNLAPIITVVGGKTLVQCQKRSPTLGGVPKQKRLPHRSLLDQLLLGLPCYRQRYFKEWQPRINQVGAKLEGSQFNCWFVEALSEASGACVLPPAPFGPDWPFPK